MTMFMWIFSLLVSSMVVGLSVPVSASGQGASPVDQHPVASEPKTTITSKRMTVKNQESRAIFEGSVVLTRGPLIVHSDVMVITFQSTEASGSDSVKIPAACRRSPKKPDPTMRAPREAKTNGDAMPAVSNRSICLMEATGHVTIEKDDGRATSRKAVYDVNDRTIVLTGDPVACQRGTRVSGEKIIMYLDDDRSEVEGGSQVTINPDGDRCTS